MKNEYLIQPALTNDSATYFKPKPLTRLKTEAWLARQLGKADIILNGSRPWDPQIHNPEVYARILNHGSLGAGESYMDGWWDCEQLDEMMCRILRTQLGHYLSQSWLLSVRWLKAKIFNLQSLNRAYQVGEKHYDLGNDLFTSMLDETMSYSCGYWYKAHNLYEAQLAKLELICQKLGLEAGESVLDIGCGWGSFAEYAARYYQSRVTGITVSVEQKKLAEERCAGLPVVFEVADYRKLKGNFEKLVSIGMFEHVGLKNHNTYMRTAQHLMTDRGLFLLHTIGNDMPKMGTDPWIEKYIFPNGDLPALSQLSQACEPYFIIEDVHNFGPDYDRTLIAWHDNFVRAKPCLRSNYSRRFFRMWSYYLKVCAGAFRSRSLQLYQLVLRRRLTPLPRYHCPR